MVDISELKDATEHEKRVFAAKKSLTRVQDFNPASLVQREKFGHASFDEAVAPAQRIVELFRQLPASTLDLLPPSELEIVQTQSDSVFQLFEEILEFDIDAGDVKNRKTQFIEKLKSSYQSHFSRIFHLVSY